MTLALRELQAAFADHLLAGPRPDLVAAIVGGRLPAEARLRIHRHHVLTSLAKVLEATFPTVSRLVGEDFFAGMARAFIVAEPPAQPVLAEYGKGFAAFIDTYAPAQGLPYLADMARLDWALGVAFSGSFGPCLTADTLAAIPAEELPARNLLLMPGATLLDSPYPLDRIWNAARRDASTDKVDVGAGGVRLLIYRQTDDSAFLVLGPGEAVFLSALANGAALEQATEAAFGCEAGFDLSRSFPRLLSLGVFAAVQ
ncbi:MAG: putative DNA-binding domain-containing protein [Alphaproteobacteria bacterium]|nr:putative DNA-binding domain-containing protein [Alphaproteobacteria bacterium]